MSIERLSPVLVNDNIGTVEHLHRYALAIELCKNKKVLDVASGDGYGSFLLSHEASHVTGVDISTETVEIAKTKYQNNNLTFLQGSALEIPVGIDQVDVVVSFETIEHLTEQEILMTEFKRVLKADGVLILSSPAKEFYHMKDPNNPYHKKELTTEEFLKLCKENFRYCHFLYERSVTGTLISKDQETGFESEFKNTKFYDGNIREIVGGKILNKHNLFNIPFYVIAVCSDTDFNFTLPELSFFDGSSVNKAQLDFLKANLKTYQNSRALKLIQSIKRRLSFLF